MKICMIVEGCYPYVVGGVSSWVQSMIQSYKEHEFIILAINTNREDSGKFAYTIPENVSEVRELYLQDVDWVGKRRKKKFHLKSEEIEALRSLILGEEIQWKEIFNVFESGRKSINMLLMSSEFFYLAKELYDSKYSNVLFSDFLWTLRSMYLPLFYVLNFDIPKADIYHSVATGYAGIFASMGKLQYGGASLISEHGIYTREREEELIKAKWVKGEYKDIWIEQFNKMSICAYQYADKVTALFAHARELQIELGCPKEKAVVVPNGVNTHMFEDIKGRNEDDTYINAGAILRVTPIKDVKTMLQAFAYAKQKDNRLKLWIMGPMDEDPQYSSECVLLAQSLGLEDIEFTGRVQVKDYIGRMDMLLLTSISEGQPLTILEGFCAKKPCIATNVGNCSGLILGERDEYGPAGIITPVMSVEKIGEAILRLAQDEKLRILMGEIGYKRCNEFYRKEQMIETFGQIYEELALDEKE